MADEPVDSRAGDDDIARLVALTERQHELWDLLRDTKDEQVRNGLLDELTANREELANLKTKVSSEVDHPLMVPPVIAPNAELPAGDHPQPHSVGEQLRSRILSPDAQTAVAPSQPPPPPSPPSNVAPPPAAEEAARREESDASGMPPPRPHAEQRSVGAMPQTGSMSAEPAVPSPDEPEEIDPDLLLPEKTPYRSREDDLAATRARKQQPAARPAPVAIEPDAVAEIRAERRQAAHDAMRDLEKMRPHHPPRRRRLLFPLVAILVAVVAVVLATWFLFFADRDSESSTTTSTTTTTLAGLGEQSSAAAQIRAVLTGMGLTGVTVEERSGTIFLSGSVDSEADRKAVIGAAQALAGAASVDAGGLAVAVLDDDLRTAAIAAISAAGFDRVNVSVSRGVATLTGVTPEAGSAELIAAVKTVDGIMQVVDMTEAADRAAALATELNRVTAVTPLIFQSGQITLNALQERILDSAAEIILAYDGPIVTVVGYTDAAGTTEENQRISLQRAQEVRDYLMGQGVPEERLAVDARGETGSTGSESVAGLERRVEFEVGYAVPSGGNAAFRIGIVAPSAADDLAFTQSIVDAAAVIAGERGDVGIDISDGLFVTEDAEAAIRSYAAAGYDLVIAHGSQYGPSLAAIAPEFPNVAFAWGTAADTFDLPNVSAYEVAADQGGYVMGTIAARLTESKVIGIVGPLEVGDAALYINGFTAGVSATDANVAVRTNYIGSFSDLGLAAEAASADVAAGADVLTGSAQMVVGAVGVAVDNGALWFGNQSNQTELAPNLVVASQVYHWEVALRQIISGLDQGVLGGETYTLTLANGGIVIEYNPGFDLSPELRDAADTVTAGIIDGSLSTGR